MRIKHLRHYAGFASTFALCACVALGCAALEGAETALEQPRPLKGEIRPIDIGDLHFKPGENAVLKFKGNLKPDVSSLECRISDIWNKEVATKTAEASADGVFSLELALPQGYYELTFPTTGQTFGVCALPEYAGRKDPFFNIDCALSWWLWHDDLNRTTGMIRFLGKCGVSLARERVYWSEINPADGQFRMNMDVYEKTRQAYVDNGMQVLEMVHDAPAYLKPCAKSVYPQNMEKTRASWDAIASKWSKYWGGVEIWNEPDLASFGGGVPLDQFASLAQTMLYVQDKRGIEVPAGGPPFALHNTGLFIDTLPQSGILDQLDYMSFHYYADASGLERVVSNYRNWLAANARETMPIWITEAGAYWSENRPPRPKFDDCMHFALEITRKTVESKACGVARHFPFVYAYYGQHKKGMMGEEGTPLRAMAAYDQCIKALSNKAYAGDLKARTEGVSKIRVFESEDEMVAVVCSASAKPDGKAKAFLPALKAEGLDGRKLELSADGSVSTPDGLTYVWLDKKAAAPLLDKSGDTMRLWSLGQAQAPEKKKPSPLVLRFRLDAFSFGDAYYFAKSQKFSAQATNLSDEACETTLSLEGSTHWKAKGESAKPLSLPPHSSKVVDWEVEFAGNFKISSGKECAEHIKIKSADFNGFEGGSMAIPVLPELSEKEWLALFSSSRKLETQDLGRWENYASSNAKFEKRAMPEGAVAFHVEAEDKNSTTGFWAHPLFKLSPNERDLRDCWILATVKTKAPLMLAAREERKCAYVGTQSLVPADGQWHTTPVSLRALALLPGHFDPNGKADLERIKMISIGTNCRPSKTMDFEIKSICLVK